MQWRTWGARFGGGRSDSEMGEGERAAGRRREWVLRREFWFFFFLVLSWGGVGWGGEEYQTVQLVEDGEGGAGGGEGGVFEEAALGGEEGVPGCVCGV